MRKFTLNFHYTGSITKKVKYVTTHKHFKVRDQLANLKLPKTGQTDPKAAMRLPTCPPPKFTGINLDYIPWKRLWGETMGQGYKEAVQLMQLKSSVPTRTANLIGLS